MSRGKRNFIIGVSLMLAFVSILGCLPNKQGGVSCNIAPLISRVESMLPKTKALGPSTDVQSTTPHDPPRTGDIVTGPKTELAAKSVGPSGGMVAVSKPGDALDGFVIDVPDKAFTGSQTFKVSSAPITKQSFGNDINPITPMITVDNGGGYSDKIMYVRIPARVPEGCFAMGFIYDPATRQLEGLPTVGQDSQSITVATRHFCDFFISSITEKLLSKGIYSGFKPHVDDWQFGNWGSYLVPQGQCEGQAVSAMWYYCNQPDGKNVRLWGTYDNNGNSPKTPGFWQDDSLAYRFTCVVQHQEHDLFANILWSNLGSIDWVLNADGTGWNIVPVPGIGIGDNLTFDLFAYSILVTNEPQQLSMRNQKGDGHAIVCYGASNNQLCVADPNMPGDPDRRITLSNGKFQAYESGVNAAAIAAGYKDTYETIFYKGKRTEMNWQTIADHWQELKSKTIGNVNKEFPSYQVMYTDDKGKDHPLNDGYVSPGNLCKIKVDPQDFKLVVTRNAVEINPDSSGNYELTPGNNKLGFEILGNAAKSGNPDWKYIDFKYINITYNGLRIEPPSMSGETNKDYTFTAKIDNPPSNARYVWSINDKQVQSGPGASLKTKFSDPKPYTISVDLLDGSGKEIDTATASAAITAATPANSNSVAPSGKLADLKIFQHLQMGGQLSAVMRVETTSQSGVKTTTEERGIPIQAKFDKITWSGTTFSCEQTSSQDSNGWSWSLTRTVKGQVSSDGMNIESLVLSENSKNSNGEYRNLTVTLSNIPLEYVGVKYGRMALFNAYDAATMNPHLNIGYEYKDLSAGAWSAMHTFQSLGRVAQCSVGFVDPP